MKQHFLQRKGNQHLILFFSGWGGDEQLFDYPLSPEFDYLLCFDYTDEHFDASLLSDYEQITVYAWSMGVYMAPQVLSGIPDLPLRKAFAFNGTPYPKDNERGIPRQIFEQTLAQFSPAGLVKFRRRICGSTAQVHAFLAHQPYRSLESLHEELAALDRRIDIRPAAPFEWDMAIIGENDLIFVPENQQRAWADTATVLLSIAHYDDATFARLFSNPLMYG